MADIQTRRIDRSKLAKVFVDHELQVAFENLTQDVAQTLPAQTDELTQLVSTLQGDTTALQGQVTGLAMRVTAAELALDGLQAQIDELNQNSESLLSQLASVREITNAALSAINDLNVAPL